MNRPLIALALIASLAACGSRTVLYPKPGMTQVPKAASADRTQTGEELIRPSTQAQPDRQADLLTRSVERRVDPFDLPPGTRGDDAAGRTTAPRPDNVAPDDNITGEGLPDEPTRTDDRAPEKTIPDGRTSSDRSVQ